MNNYKKIIFLGLMIVSCASRALTGNELLADLLRDDTSYQYGYSSGYLGGVLAISTVFQGGNYLCIPDGVTNRQSIDVIKNYLQNSPEKRHLDASLLIYSALAKTWPCPKQMPANKSK